MQDQDQKQRSPWGLLSALGFLGACVWLIQAGHEWEGVTLGVVFLIIAAFK